MSVRPAQEIWENELEEHVTRKEASCKNLLHRPKIITQTGGSEEAGQAEKKNIAAYSGDPSVNPSPGDPENPKTLYPEGEVGGVGGGHGLGGEEGEVVETRVSHGVGGDLR